MTGLGACDVPLLLGEGAQRVRRRREANATVVSTYGVRGGVRSWEEGGGHRVTTRFVLLPDETDHDIAIRGCRRARGSDPAAIPARKRPPWHYYAVVSPPGYAVVGAEHADLAAVGVGVEIVRLHRQCQRASDKVESQRASSGAHVIHNIRIGVGAVVLRPDKSLHLAYRKASYWESRIRATRCCVIPKLKAESCALLLRNPINEGFFRGDKSG